MLDLGTNHEYQTVYKAFAWFNRELFADSLPSCHFALARMTKARGYFWSNKMIRRGGKTYKHEIALNPDYFPHRTDREILSTLVHEMVHVWQFESGTPGRRGYHNREWASKMKSIGLTPTSTGQPGGKETGERVTHLIVRRGPYSQAFSKLVSKGFRLHWQSFPRLSGGQDDSKRKFTCPTCLINVWGAQTLEGIVGCRRCECQLVIQ